MTVLTAYVILLLAIPAPMVVPALGTAGNPATIVAMTSFALWLWFHIQRDQRVSDGRQPVRAAMLGWLLLMLAVYAHAMSRPIPGDEVSPGDSGMLRLLGVAGVVLVANDGIHSLKRHRSLVARLVAAVGIVALLGIVQTITKQLWIDRISIPGLRAGAADWVIALRSGLIRPSGTATHPIEYGMVLTTVLPLAMTYARSAPRRRWLYRVFLMAIAIAIVLAISRSAMICAAVAFGVTVASWPLLAKIRASAAVLAVVTLVFMTVPGVLGTITNLFLGAANDSSVASRMGSYDVASLFITRSPWLGRGFGTFLPKYWILDNGYLGLLIEGGLAGVVGLLIVLVVGLTSSSRAARIHRQLAEPDHDFDRQIARALVASIAAGTVGLAFFDTFSFPQSAGIFFLLIGLSGAARRLATESEREHRPPALSAEQASGRGAA